MGELCGPGDGREKTPHVCLRVQLPLVATNHAHPSDFAPEAKNLGLGIKSTKIFVNIDNVLTHKSQMKRVYGPHVARGPLAGGPFYTALNKYSSSWPLVVRDGTACYQKALSQAFPTFTLLLFGPTITLPCGRLPCVLRIVSTTAGL